MDYRLTAHDRAEFKRCRRRWDLGARRALEPVDPGADLERAVKDALAVYYFPGMWDWRAAIVLPLVRQALHRSFRRRPATDGQVGLAEDLIRHYVNAAPQLDDFSPVKIDTDVEVNVPDPAEPERGIATPAGDRVRFVSRVDLLAVDAHDAYWVVCHRLVPRWLDTDLLLLDEDALAACWAWEECYLGMEIAGTIHNELRTDLAGDPPPDDPPPSGPERGGLKQHEGSGGGRSVPQHRRHDVAAREPAAPDRITQRTVGPVRRTWIRRNRLEITDVAALIAAEVRDMTDPRLVAYPTPAPHCADCAFALPCQVQSAGGDPEPVLADRYRPRPPADPTQGRLGAENWGFGRGSAPPPRNGI